MPRRRPASPLDRQTDSLTGRWSEIQLSCQPVGLPACCNASLLDCQYPGLSAATLPGCWTDSLLDSHIAGLPLCFPARQLA
jgi:hypothetical protein